MFCTRGLRSVVRLFLTLAVTIGSLLVGPGDATAAARHALVVGIGDYKDKSGINRLVTPANDADEMKLILERRNIGFTVDLLKDDTLPDKAAFDSALQTFLSRVNEDDDVLFYFSGHGYHLPGKGNFFLLGDAKSEPDYFIDLKKSNPLELRGLDTQALRTKKYEDWISQIALSETEIERAILQKKPKATVIIADASRTLVTGSTGGAAIVAGAVAPADAAPGVFKLYSASKGQASLERAEEIELRKIKKPDTKKQAADKPANAKTRRAGRKLLSLYTRRLLKEIPTPRLDIAILHEKVRLVVRAEARRLQVLQVPEFSRNRLPQPFLFWRGDDSQIVAARCWNSKNELENLRFGIRTGSVSRDALELKRVELAPCGHEREVAAYLKLQQQGAGATSATSSQAGARLRGDQSDFLQQCDELAASRFDLTRPEGIQGSELQSIALEGMAGGVDRQNAVATISAAISACEKAVKERSRVARYKYNLARAHYAMSVLATEPLTRDDHQEKASRLGRDAADLGHAPAYHMLAMMHLNGEYWDSTLNAAERAVGDQPADSPATAAPAAPKLDRKPLPPDRKRTRELLQRGADLGHVLALYDLGLAYKNGELGVEAKEVGDVTSDAKAYQFLSKAQESGFVPATIETATFLRDGWGTVNRVEPDPPRAIALLLQVAAGNSPEAMYQIAEIHRTGCRSCDEETAKRLQIRPDLSEAFIWYARAAEFGDARAQEHLASMLTEGHGLPAPQPQTAARYWRLAADSGAVRAQMTLANLLREGKIPFRTKDINTPGGAEEIRRLYEGAFARGTPRAGLELARLFRKGFPEGATNGAIPRDPEQAIELLWDTMTSIRHAPQDSAEANPDAEYEAASELIAMYDANEAVRDGASLISDDQIEQLRADYGDPAKAFWINASVLGSVRCKRGPSVIDEKVLYVQIWDSKGREPPTERQFEWFEQARECKDYLAGVGKKRAELGVSKAIRDVIRKEFEAAEKDREKNPDTYKKFTDRMADLMDKKGKNKKR